jgi:hypothetical protein
MTRSLRLTDLAFTLGAIALVTVLLGHPAESRVSTGVPGPLTISEAVAFYSDGPLAVRGFLVNRSGRVLLCERRRCAGPRLSVSGLRGVATRHSAVVALGVVTDGRIALLRLPLSAGPAGPL